MQNILQSDSPTDQVLSNLRFLIQLQLQAVSALADPAPETAQAHGILRRLMDMEETLRDQALASVHASRVVAA